MPIGLERSLVGKVRPVILCDSCGHKIESAEEGNCYWTVGEANSLARFCLVHARCSLALESTERTLDWQFEPLERFLGRLVVRRSGVPRLVQGWRRFFR